MSQPLVCPKCDAPIPGDAPAGLCPNCLVRAGLESESHAERPLAPTDPAPSGFEPPPVEYLASRFPQLEVLELLGKGGMGAVYKARQKELDRLVALKILPPEVAHHPAFAERFTREARALARLSHPNIVTVYDFGRTSGPPPASSTEVPAAGADGGLFYFIMEYVEGVNLRQAIQSGGMSPKEALAIVPQICDALQFAHDEGIVHRDIKPENILVDRRGRVKIADFGLAKLLGHAPGDESLTGSQQVMGTLRYMAPEQFEGTKDVDHRADIYSLGVVFYELLTGELPIGRFAPPSKKVEIDVRLDDVVLRALEKEPEQRYQHVSEVKTEVDAIRGSAPAVSGRRSEGRPVAWERAQAGSWTALRFCLMLAAWTAVVVGACVYVLPKAMMEWLPWAYDERWNLELKPQSGAYPKITLGGERRLYCWGQCGADPDRMISRSRGRWRGRSKQPTPGRRQPCPWMRFASNGVGAARRETCGDPRMKSSRSPSSKG
jgi:predicted Ser/Thr protein kinase